jgi:hypothetical protein
VVSVQANCPSVQSGWGSYFSTVQISSVGNIKLQVGETTNYIDTSDNTNIFKLYPVPSSSQLNVLYNASQHGRVDIIVFNQLGSSVMRKNVVTTAGPNNYALNVEQLKNGIYIVKLIDGNNVHVQKLVVQR